MGRSVVYIYRPDWTWLPENVRISHFEQIS